MALPVAVGGKVSAADINSVANLPVANFAALPSSDNWLGRIITATDTGISYRWSGSAWVAAEWNAGSVLLAHATVSANETTIDSRTLGGALFQSDCLNYEVVVELSASSAATGIDVIMRSSVPADYTTGNQINRRFEMNGATPAYTNSTIGTAMRAGRSNGTGGGSARFTILGPQAAQYTKLMGKFHDVAISGEVWNHIPNTNVFTGMKVKLEGVVTGTGFVTVYGLRK